MDYDQRIKAALQLGCREGLTGQALERRVAGSIGLDRIDDAATVHRVADSFRRLVHPVSRKQARPTGPTLFG